MKCVFVDVDTQLDFLFPTGALYVPGAELIVERLGELTRYAAAQRIPLLSTADAHREDDAEFADWPPHCVAGTLGQRKAAVTLLEKRTVIPNRAGEFRAGDAPQVILEKQSTNCFTNPHLDALLAEWPAERYVVYGVVTEICVKHAVLGLLERGRAVTLISDAVKSIDQRAANELIQQVLSRAGRLATVADVLSGSE